MTVKTYKTFNVQGYKVRTKSSEESNNTQNSGVVVIASTPNFASTKDNCPEDGDVTYYGVVKDIIEVAYTGGRKVVLFECDWADSKKNKIDSKGFKLVDFTRPSRNVNPYVLPSQILQAFYVPDPRDPPWVVPVITKPRDNYDLNRGEPMDDFLGGCLEILPIQTNAPASNVFDDMEE